MNYGMIDTMEVN